MADNDPVNAPPPAPQEPFKPPVPEGFPELDAINPNMPKEELEALLSKLKGFDQTMNAEEAAERAMMQHQAEQAMAELRAKNLKTNLHIGGGLLAGTAGLLGGIYGGKKLWERFHQPKPAPMPAPPVPQEPDTEHMETRPMPEPKQADDLTGLTLPPRAENTINSLESLLVDQPTAVPDMPSSLAGYDLDFIPNTHERDALVQQLMEPEMKQANWLGDVGRRIGGASPEFIESRNFISGLGKDVREQKLLEQHARRLGVINDVPPAPPPEPSFLQKYKTPLIGAGVLGGAYLANQNGMFDSPRQQGDQYMQPKFSHDKGYADMLARLGLYKEAVPAPPPKAIASSFKKAPELAKKTPPPVPPKAKKDYNDVQRTMGFSKNSAAFDAGYYDTLASLNIKVAGRGAPVKRVLTSASDAMRGSAMSAASNNLGRVPGMGGAAAKAAPAAAAAPKAAPAAPKTRTPKTQAPADQPMIPADAPKIGPNPNPNKTTQTLRERQPAIRERNAQKEQALNAADPSRATRGAQFSTLNGPSAAVKPPPTATAGAAGAAGGPLTAPPRTQRPTKAPAAPPTPPPGVNPVGAAAGAGAPTPPPNVAPVGGAATTPPAAVAGAAAPPAGPGFGQQIKDTWGKMPGWGKGLSIGGAAGLGGMGMGAMMGSAGQPDVNIYR